MERSVGESIDGKNIAAMLGEPRLEEWKILALQKFVGRACRQAQADRIGLVFRTHLGPDFQGVLLQRTQCFRPRFSRMNVRAVGQVVVVIKMHGTNEVMTRFAS